MTHLNPEQRKSLEQVLLRHYRSRYPGRPVTARWKDDPVEKQPREKPHEPR